MMRSARSGRRVPALLVLAALVLLLLPAAALGLDTAGTQVTIDQTTGGQATRLTFSTATSGNETVLGIDFVFPPGSDLASAGADAVTLVGLNRADVAVKAVPEGTTLHVIFTPAVEPSSTLRVVLHNVVTPVTGGNLAMKGTYTTQAGTQPLPTLAFQQTAPSMTERIMYWLDNQAWVAAWNKVPILNGFFKPQLIVQSVPLLFFGWLLSIGLIAVAYPLAIPIGLATAFLKMSKFAPLRWIASAYINVIRGTPLFLQIYIAFFGLPLIGIQLPDIPLGMFVLAINSAAYMAEIFRAGIQSINKGQFEAANSLGMTYWQAMQHVIIPQTVRRVLPTMTSEFILLFKDTALLSAVGIFELMMNGKNSAANAGNVTAYTVAAVYYLIITIPLINWVQRLEARLALSETGQAPPSGKKRRGVLQELATDVAISVDPYRASAPESIHNDNTDGR
jgi:polar amino acid transport system substrate-binding protein